MRLSADNNSPHFDPYWSRYATVFVDGVAVRGCIEVDSDEGWADVVLLNDAGKPGLPVWPTQRLTGVVSISLLQKDAE